MAIQCTKNMNLELKKIWLQTHGPLLLSVCKLFKHSRVQFCIHKMEYTVILTYYTNPKRGLYSI